MHRVIGAVSKGGREGHVTEREAAAKAVRIMQQEFASDLARSIAAHVYGETDLPGRTPCRPAVRAKRCSRNRIIRGRSQSQERRGDA